MEIKALANELVLAVIRGQLPLSALEEAGVTLEIDKGETGQERRCRLNVKAPFKVEPKPSDIASGLLTYKDQKEQLEDWAAFVLNASEIIDLTPLEAWPEGDQLLNGLWDASFEGVVKLKTLQVAAALTGS